MRIEGFAMQRQGEPLTSFEYEASPGPGEVLVEVTGCGVCHTDLGFLDEGVPTRHAMPLVLGHEVAGRVAAVGEGVADLEGKSIIVPAVIPCGECAVCKKGRGSICKKQVFPGNDIHGGFASHLVVPAHGVVPVDLPVGPKLARLSVVADAVSTAYQAVVRSGAGAGDLCIFVGAGGVGGFGVQIASAIGAKVIAIDVDAERLASLRGADFIVDATGKDAKAIKKEVRGLAKEHGLPGVEWKIFETSGTAPGQDTAFNLLNFGAYLSVVGFHHGAVKVRLSNLMAFDARAEGNWGCLPSLYPQVLELVVSGRVEVEPYVEMFPLSEINQVFDRLRAGELKKRPVLLPRPL